MAVAYRSSANGGQTTGSSASVTEPSGDASTDVLIVNLYKESNSAVTPPAGFTQRDTVTNTNSSPNHSMFIFWGVRSVVGAGPWSFTWSGTPYYEWGVACYSGAVSTGLDPFEVASAIAADASNDNTEDCPAVIPTLLDDFLVCCVGTFGNGPHTAPTGMTLSYGPTAEVGSAHLQLSVAGTTGTKQFTQTGAGFSNGWSGALKTVTTEVLPFFVGAGTQFFTATNNTDLSPALPAGWMPNDIHVLLAARSDNTAMTSLSGWTLLSAGNNTSAQRVEVWWRRAVAGDTGPTVTFGTGTTVRGAVIYGIRGCNVNGSPFAQTSRSDNAAAATITFTDVTTGKTNHFVLALGTYEDDPTTITTMTNWTQPAGAVQGSSLGNDMMLCYEWRQLAAAGAAGASTVTVSGGTFTNSVNTGILLDLIPATYSPPVYQRRWRYLPQRRVA